ncbi:hypothetical protein GOP47_0029567 [Adiantum capillus-veneris]|nr:hypothetical protein GOP47_0029567 [Adiantum capillus-veneris]
MTISEQEDGQEGCKRNKKMSKSMHYYKEEGGSDGDAEGEVQVKAEEPQPRKGRPSPSKSTPWPKSFQAPESKRKRRIASYKMYHVERKLKTSLSDSLLWLKSHIPYYTW